MNEVLSKPNFLQTILVKIVVCFNILSSRSFLIVTERMSKGLVMDCDASSMLDMNDVNVQNLRLLSIQWTRMSGESKNENN